MVHITPIERNLSNQITQNLVLSYITFIMVFSASISSGLKCFLSGGFFSVVEQSLELFDEDKTDGTEKLYTGEILLIRLILR